MQMRGGRPLLPPSAQRRAGRSGVLALATITVFVLVVWRHAFPVAMLSGGAAKIHSFGQVDGIVADANKWWQQRPEGRGRADRGPVSPQALHARTHVSASDLAGLVSSDVFNFLSQHCCRVLFFPATAQAALPLSLQGGVNGDLAQRLRDFVGHANSLVFNGADANTLEFVNQYFGTEMKLTDVISSFKMRAAYEIAGDQSTPMTYPEKIEEELPDTLDANENVNAVDTATLPPATAVVYSNFPRTPTGSPMFMLKYCQIANPYVQDGVRITVSPPDCAAAGKDLGSECSCGTITLIGFEWDKSGNNIWDATRIDAQVMAEYLKEGAATPHPLGEDIAAEKVLGVFTKVGDSTAGPAVHTGTGRGPGRGRGRGADRRSKARSRAEAHSALHRVAAAALPSRADVRSWRNNHLQALAQSVPPLVESGRQYSNQAAGTVVDRQPQASPAWGIDSENRDVIPEWERQDAGYDFWSREGGWRNMCGRRQHPMYDPEEKKFYFQKSGEASNYVKHWCNCQTRGAIEIATKDGADTLGCDDMYATSSNMRKLRPSQTRSADTYLTSAPGYAHQRVLDRHDDRRWDERYPTFVRGYGSDRGIWMDENDAGPAPVIDDFHEGIRWAPREGSVVQHHVKSGLVPDGGASKAEEGKLDSKELEDEKQHLEIENRLMAQENARLEGAGVGKSQQKVIVDAWGRPLTHQPTSADYPTGSGDYDSVPPSPPSTKAANLPGKPSKREDHLLEPVRVTGVTESVTARKSVQTRAAAARSAADAADAVATAMAETVSPKLLRKREETEREADTAAAAVLARDSR